MDQFSYVVIGVAAVLFAFAGLGYALFRSFNSFIIFLWLGISDLIWGLFMGAPGNFKDGFMRHDPLNTLGTIHTGGPLVAALRGMLFIAIQGGGSRMCGLKCTPESVVGADEVFLVPLQFVCERRVYVTEKEL